MFNGYRAALSLTFDDGLQCQVKNAIPLMNQYDIQGTFFLIKNSPYGEFDKSAWIDAISKGHEIGSHSVNHLKAGTLTEITARHEAQTSKQWIEDELKISCDSFCFPFTDAIPVIQDAVRNAGYKQARGGRVARMDKYILPRSSFNEFNIPCFHINGGTFEDGVLFAWIDAALERGAWLTLMFHSVGDELGWDNVPVEKFEQLMQFLDAAKKRGLWVAPFGTIAEDLRKCR